MLATPSRVVARDDDGGVERGEVGAGAADDRLEYRAAEVEAAHHGTQPLHAGQRLRVAGGVDLPGMAAAGDDHQAPVADVHDDRLVVEGEGSGSHRRLRRRGRRWHRRAT